MINVCNKVKNNNGYISFVKIMEKTFDTTNKQLYYWLFNNSTDKPVLESYVNYSSNDSTKNIKIMIEELYRK
jgi:hypothetical protein